MKKIILITIGILISTSVFSQIDIVKRKVTLDTLKARNDSVYINSPLSVNDTARFNAPIYVKGIETDALITDNIDITNNATEISDAEDITIINVLDSVRPSENITTATDYTVFHMNTVVDSSGYIGTGLNFRPIRNDYKSLNAVQWVEGFNNSGVVSNSVADDFYGFRNTATIDGVNNVDSIYVGDFYGFFNQIINRQRLKATYSPFIHGIYNKINVTSGQAGGKAYVDEVYGIRSIIDYDADIVNDFGTVYGMKIEGTLNEPGQLGYVEDFGDNLFTNKITTLDTIVTPVLVLGDTSAHFLFEGDSILTKKKADELYGGGGSFTTDINDNLIAGDGAGASITTGSRNTMLGKSAGNLVTTTNDNTFYGNEAGKNAGGSNNIAIGSDAGSSVIGINNTMLGTQSGFLTADTDYNVFIGRRAGYLNVTGEKSVFIGASAGNSNTSGAQTFIGYEAGSSTTSGTANTFIGYSSGFSNLTGSNNTYIGDEAGSGATGGNNVSVGVDAGKVTSGSFNTFLGATAGFSNTSGAENVFSGYRAGYTNTTGKANVVIGAQAGFQGTDLDDMVIIGTKAAQFFGSNKSVFIGNEAGLNSNTADDCIFIGDQAGKAGTGNLNIYIGSASGFTTTTGQANTFLGYRTGFSNITGSNNVFIGYEAGYNETGSDKLYIDNTSTTDPLIKGDFSTNILTINGLLNVEQVGDKVLSMSGSTAGGTLNVKIGDIDASSNGTQIEIDVVTDNVNVTGGLTVNTTSEAFVVPRMTTAQRTALTAINGSIVYDTDLNAFYFYENSTWVTK